MIMRVVTIALTGALTAPVWTLAHEGHEHVLMGVVQKVEGESIEVKVRDEKANTEKVFVVAINEKTEVLRGDRPVKASDIQVGERIVVRAVMTKDPKGRELYTARRLQVALRPASSPW